MSGGMGGQELCCYLSLTYPVLCMFCCVLSLCVCLSWDSYFGAGGREFNGLVHVSDWMPTFIALAGGWERDELPLYQAPCAAPFVCDCLAHRK